MKNFNFIKIFTKRHYIEKIKEKTLEFNKEFIQSNKTIIILFSLIFLYLCYLSVPALYNEQIIKSKLEDEISSSFRSKNIEFESFRYTFFPKPHFNIKNVIIKKEDSNKKIIEIKNMNIFISQKNFFTKNYFKINSIKIINANINLQSLNYIEKILSKPIKKKIFILKSKIFLNDKNDSTFSIVTIDKFRLFFEEKKNYNNLMLHGSVFNLPFKLNYLNNFYNNKNDLKINFSKIKLNFENNSKLDNYYKARNEIRFLNSKFITNIDNKKNENIYELLSNESKINQINFSYSGTVNIKPFYFQFNSKISNINLLNIIFFNKIFENILINFFLDNNSLNGKINIHIDDIKKSKYFEKGKIILNINRGKFDLSGTEFIIKNIGNIKIVSNQFLIEDDKLNMQFNSKLTVVDKDKLYKKFLIPRKNRLNLKEIYYLMDIYPSSRETIISNFEINEKNNKFYQDTNFSINTWQDLRNMFNDLLINYDG